MKEVWYLLFDGSSPDGRGNGKYVGRTKNKAKALNHFKKVKSNPYSTGSVVAITDNEKRLIAWEKDFETYPE